MPSYDVAIDQPGKARRVVPMTITPKRDGKLLQGDEARAEARRMAASMNEVPVEWVKLAEQVPAPAPKTRRRA